MKKFLSLMGTAFALLTSACTQVNMAVVNVPTHFDDITVTKNVSFGPAFYQKLDIYSPPRVSKAAHLPVIVFYYGGRWEEGSKELYRFVGSALAKQNFIVVIPDYRKYPEVKFPVFVEDAAQSLAWTSDNIQNYGGNPNDIHLAGHSAGAHIASLLTTDPRYLKKFGKDRSKVIRDFVGLAGPYSFTPDEKDLKDMFGPPQNYPLMQATTFIDGKQPPMFLLWGNKDQYVGRINMDKMESAIKTKGGCIKTKIYPDTDHIWLLGDLSWIGSDKHGVLNDWVKYLRQNSCFSKQP